MTNKFTPIMRIAAWIIVFAMMPVVTFNGKTTTTALVPRTIHENECYVIYIKAFNGEKWQTEDFCVSPEVYDAVQIGDIFDYDKQRSEE